MGSCDFGVLVRRCIATSFGVAALICLLANIEGCDLRDPAQTHHSGAGGISLALVHPPDEESYDGAQGDSASGLMHAYLYQLGFDSSSPYSQRPACGDPGWAAAASSDGESPLVLEISAVTEETWWRVFVESASLIGQTTFPIEPHDIERFVIVVLPPHASGIDRLTVYDGVYADALSATTGDHPGRGRGAATLIPVAVENLAAIGGLDLVFMIAGMEEVTDLNVMLDPGSRFYDSADRDAIRIDSALLDATVPEEPVYQLRIDVEGDSGESPAIGPGTDILFYVVAYGPTTEPHLCLLPGHASFLDAEGEFQVEPDFDAPATECTWAPRARDDEFTCLEDGEVTHDLLENDIDFDGLLDPASVTIELDPPNGAIVAIDAGSVTYRPAQGYVGQDQFTYTVLDVDGNASNRASAQITIQAMPCTVSPTVLDFGEVLIGERSLQSFAIINEGAEPLSGEVALSGCSDDFALQSGGGAYALPSGSSHQVSVAYAPSVTGEVSCTITAGTGGCADVIASGVGIQPVCSVDPEALDFGQVSVGESAIRSITIANTGTGVLSGTVTLGESCDGFTLATDPFSYDLQGGESATVEITFRPATAGDHECTILTGTSCSDVTVVATGTQAACTISTPTLAFGDVPVGTLATQSFSITNDGSETLSGTVSLGEGCGSFALPAEPFGYDLEAGQSVMVEVGFAPTADEDYQCTIITGTSCSDVTAEGSGVQAQCTVSAATLAFGDVPVDSLATQSFSITNTGLAVLTGVVSLGGGCEAFELASDPLPYELGAGESAIVEVRFSPPGEGNFQCTLETGGGCLDVTASGTGVEPLCEVEPQSLEFGEVLVGESAILEFTLSNAGTGRLGGAVSLDPGCTAFGLETEPFEYDLGAGESVMLEVTFAPEAEGVYACTILTGEQCSEVTATATGIQPGCDVGPAALVFGELDVGGSAVLGLTITNVGTGTLSGAISLGAGCEAFALPVDPVVYELAAEQSVSLDVTFVPLAGQEYQCTIETGDGCADVTATGTGLQPQCEVEPAVLAFGEILADSSVVRALTITNTGTGTLSGAVRLGDGCGVFSLPSDPFAYELEAEQSVSVDVTFLPLAAEDYQCAIETGEGCAEVTATGTGLQPHCEVEPTVLAFGDIPVDGSAVQTFTITNTGTGTLTGTINLGTGCEVFSLPSDPFDYELEALQSVNVDVTFLPVAGAEYECTILVGEGCTEITVTGTGLQPQCEVEPETLAFGEVRVDDSAIQTLTITNTGTGLLEGEVGLSGGCDDFGIASGGGAYALSAGQFVEVTVEFSPSGVGPGSCLVGMGNEDCSEVLCEGTGVQPVCDVSPTSLTFGTVVIGEYAEQGFSIQNTGTGTLTGSVSESCSHYSITSGLGSYSLNEGEIRNVTVRYAPSSSGTHVCEVQTGAECANVNATGEGELAPQCLVSVSELDFGVVEVDNFADLQFTITNTGGGLLEGAVTEDCPEFAITGGAAPYSLANGQNHLVTVTFTPTGDGAAACAVQAGAEAGCEAVHCTGIGAAVLCFDFDDASLEGWYVDYVLTWASLTEFHDVGASTNFQDSWSDVVNYPNAYGSDPSGDSQGSYWLDTIVDGNPIIVTVPPGDTWWLVHLQSPDLDDYAGWQEATGYSARALDHLSWAGPRDCYFSLHYTIWDEDLETERSWPDVFGTAMAIDTWQSYSVSFNDADLPENWHLRRIFVQIWGEIGFDYEGGLYLDEVCPTLDTKGGETRQNQAE
ncbi:MAG: choice-of-anchor D domain-containing protein [Candidatus Eisenbacteria sp.]|nr:choice-of-anchor D domain-containing protein [Candidatus Eisenbacteria bacterium]